MVEERRGIFFESRDEKGNRIILERVTSDPKTHTTRNLWAEGEKRGIPSEVIRKVEFLIKNSLYHPSSGSPGDIVRLLQKEVQRKEMPSDSLLFDIVQLGLTTNYHNAMKLLTAPRPKFDRVLAYNRPYQDDPVHPQIPENLREMRMTRKEFILFQLARELNYEKDFVDGFIQSRKRGNIFK